MARVLVVEDDTFFRNILRIHLATQGHEVILASGPAEGIRSILEGAPDLILSDLNMPYLSGLEMLQAIRGDEATHHIPVVMITGRTDDESYIQATQLGVTRYLTKPVLLADLIEAVQSALAESSSKRTQSPLQTE
jgi:CheY-like chemotaxis protein